MGVTGKWVRAQQLGEGERSLRTLLEVGRNVSYSALMWWLERSIPQGLWAPGTLALRKGAKIHV